MSLGSWEGVTYLQGTVGLGAKDDEVARVLHLCCVFCVESKSAGLKASMDRLCETKAGEGFVEAGQEGKFWVILLLYTVGKLEGEEHLYSYSTTPLRIFICTI